MKVLHVNNIIEINIDNFSLRTNDLDEQHENVRVIDVF
jgi:hypothetical protein